MILLLTIIFFILGLIIGSFLNVVICRLNTARSLGGRSACMSCQNKLRWYELIPVFSFVSLQGRCRTCKTKISIQYPLVELVTGLVFAGLFFKFSDVFFLNIVSFSVVYAYYAIMFSLLVVIAVYDFKHKIIPDVLSFIFGALAFVGLFFIYRDGTSLVFNLSGASVVSGFYWHIPSILGFLSGPLIASPFAFLWLVSSGRWMGFGDAKLAIGIGWLLGISLALSGLAIAFWSGAIIGICLVVISRLDSARLAKNGRIKSMGMKSEIPFAPFLVFGALLAFIFGLNLFGI